VECGFALNFFFYFPLTITYEELSITFSNFFIDLNLNKTNNNRLFHMPNIAQHKLTFFENLIFKLNFNDL